MPDIVTRVTLDKLQASDISVDQDGKITIANDDLHKLLKDKMLQPGGGGAGAVFPGGAAAGAQNHVRVAVDVG
jgi:hypothetical protein